MKDKIQAILNRWRSTPQPFNALVVRLAKLFESELVSDQKNDAQYEDGYVDGFAAGEAQGIERAEKFLRVDGIAAALRSQVDKKLDPNQSGE